MHHYAWLCATFISALGLVHLKEFVRCIFLFALITFFFHRVCTVFTRIKLYEDWAVVFSCETGLKAAGCPPNFLLHTHPLLFSAALCCALQVSWQLEPGAHGSWMCEEGLGSRAARPTWKWDSEREGKVACWWEGMGIGDSTVARQEIGLDYKVESASDLKPTMYRFKRTNVLMF